MAETPILTSADPEQLESFARFIAELRTNNVRIAEKEARRLGPYFEALSTVTADDIEAATKPTNPELATISRAAGLSGLFNQSARSTQATVLSDLVVASEDILKAQSLLKGTTQFNAVMDYNGHSFTFGFIQAFEGDKLDVNNRNITPSTAVPILAFDRKIMDSIAAHRPEAMLKALQTVATASNHDMQHHLTSAILNPDVAMTAKDKKLPSPEDLTVEDWGKLYFNNGEKDSHPKSYEAYLMFNHARVRRVLEAGPEGDALKAACDTCFAELTRIGAEMAAADSLKEAHETVDYFGTMLLFAMSRSMPLDHPLMDHAIKSLQQADPDAQKIKKYKDEILWRIESPLKEGEYAEKAIANYRAEGTELMWKEHDYASLKKLQLINIEPWVAHLMSPGQPGTELGEAQQRVSEVSREMLSASAITSWFGAVDGLHTSKRSNGETMETYFENGQLHRTNGPAIVLKDAKGQVIGEQWFEHGKRSRADGGADYLETERSGDQTTELREWHDKAGTVRHRLKTCPGTKYPLQFHREFWFDKKGQAHNENGPSTLIKDANGTVLEEEWKRHGQLHRMDGPARTENGADGRHKEVWIQNGGMNRVGAPAIITTLPDGTRVEEYYKSGLRHNENGPAYVRIKADGTREEEWHLNGQRIEAPAKQAAAKPPSIKP